MDMTGRQRLPPPARHKASFSVPDVAAVGIHTQWPTRLVREGVLERVARGTYWLAGSPLTEHHILAPVAAVLPGAIVCLLFALPFYGIGTQVPAEVSVSVDRRAASR
jgi:predicted transcriptional regulator of viral defense system